MGAYFNLWPYDVHDRTREEGLVEIVFPGIAPPTSSGRLPTEEELVASLQSWSEYEVELIAPNGSQADIYAPGARLRPTPAETRARLLGEGVEPQIVERILADRERRGRTIEIIVGPHVSVDWGYLDSGVHANIVMRGDCELALAFSRRLSAFCGPLVLLLDAMGVPVIVTPDIDFAEALLGVCGPSMDDDA